MSSMPGSFVALRRRTASTRARGFGGNVTVHVRSKVAARIDVRHVKRCAVRIARESGHAGGEKVLVKHAFDSVARVFTAHNSTNYRVSNTSFLHLGRSVLKIESNSSRKHFNMPHLLCCGVEEHVAILRRRAARTPTLEEVLHADADLSFDATDRLLQHAGIDGIGAFDLHRILQALIKIQHEGSSTGGLGAKNCRWI